MDTEGQKIIDSNVESAMLLLSDLNLSPIRQDIIKHAMETAAGNCFVAGKNAGMKLAITKIS
jgi:hypothetical protein